MPRLEHKNAFVTFGLNEVLLPANHRRMLVIVVEHLVARHVRHPLLTVSATQLNNRVGTTWDLHTIRIFVSARLGRHTKGALNCLCPTLILIVVPVLDFVDVTIVLASCLLLESLLSIHFECWCGEARVAYADFFGPNATNQFIAIFVFISGPERCLEARATNGWRT